MSPDETHQELEELNHKPIPGYRPAFWILLAITGLYLALIFIRSM